MKSFFELITQKVFALHINSGKLRGKPEVNSGKFSMQNLIAKCNFQKISELINQESSSSSILYLP